MSVLVRPFACQADDRGVHNAVPSKVVVPKPRLRSELSLKKRFGYAAMPAGGPLPSAGAENTMRLLAGYTALQRVEPGTLVELGRGPHGTSVAPSIQARR